MKNREFVQLAHTFDTGKHSLAGMMASEKLDGMRALWLPETMGLPIEEVGFANTERDDRAHVCSGLWSRYAKVIHAPLWFTGSLPKIPLDGELWIGRKKFQQTMSTVKKLVPVDSEWKDVKYMVFDSPSYEAIYQEGRIYNPNYMMQFIGTIPDGCERHILRSAEATYYHLDRMYPYLNLHLQVFLPYQTAKAEEYVENWMKRLKDGGGEGLMLRNPSSVWTPSRVHTLVKLKPWEDDEGIVVGYTEGKRKYRGMLGALVVKWKGIEFELSGMRDLERKESFFPLGTVVTFRYRELSDRGIPKEARYLRKRVD